MYTGYQSGYIAHALSLEGLAEETLESFYKRVSERCNLIVEDCNS